MQLEAKLPVRGWMAACGAIFLATFLAYGPALAAGWVWNDSDYVTAPALQSAHGLWRIWFEVGATQQYYPFLHSAFWLEHRLWGEAPLGYHLVNVCCHATSACLFSAVLFRLSRRSAPAILGGLIFALHPVCVESVAWISEQKNALSTVGYLGAALFYLRFEERRKLPDYLLGLGAFALAILSKSMAATLPGALLVLVWWRRGRLSGRRDFRPLLPWLALGAAAGLFTSWVERKYVGAEGPAFALSLPERVGVAGRVTWFYLGKTLWPGRLIFIYPRWGTAAARLVDFLPAIGVLAVGATLWAYRTKSRAPLAGFLIFLGGLFPILGFFNIYAFVFSFVADHWQYLALFGAIGLAVAGWAQAVAAGGPRRALILFALAAAGVGACGTLTWRAAHDYHDPETFYRTILARNPAAWMPHNNLGTALFQAGKLAEAEAEFEAAVRTWPDYADGHYNLGKTLLRLGNYPRAQAELEWALRLNPRDAHAADYLGQAHAASRQWPEAIQAYGRARQLGLDDAPTRYHLAVAENDFGTVLGNRGRFAEARRHFQRAVALAPGYAQAHENLARALVALGYAQEAAAQFQAVTQLRAAQRN